VLMSHFRDLLAYLRLDDYEAAKEAGTLSVLARYTRGNVLTQNGCVMDMDELDQLSKDGRAAMAEIRKHLSVGMQQG
jgi:hypothetical protein